MEFDKLERPCWIFTMIACFAWIISYVLVVTGVNGIGVAICYLGGCFFFLVAWIFHMFGVTDHGSDAGGVFHIFEYIFYLVGGIVMTTGAILWAASASAAWQCILAGHCMWFIAVAFFEMVAMIIDGEFDCDSETICWGLRVVATCLWMVVWIIGWGGWGSSAWTGAILHWVGDVCWIVVAIINMCY